MLRDGLKSGALPGDALEALDDSLEAVERIARIVGQLMDAGRGAARQPSGSDCAGVLRAAQRALAASKARIGPHVEVSLDIPPDLFVRADEHALAQVLGNLLVNAAQSIPPLRGRGHVLLRTAAINDRPTIEVVDDGVGMSEETQRRLFEPFYTTKPLGQGTGLGLAVSRGLVRTMGGELVVASSATGTSVSVVLDRAERASTHHLRTSGSSGLMSARSP